MSKTTSTTGSEKDKCAQQRRKKRKGVPGDEAGRRNPSGAERILQDAIERQQEGLGGLDAARSQLLALFGRIERMSQQIDMAFAGQMFLPDLAPDAPANRRRVMSFLRAHVQVWKLLEFALTLWMHTCGMKLEDDWVP
jgi:hypothetical protein